jgi:excisionase family DNA binding protein
LNGHFFALILCHALKTRCAPNQSRRTMNQNETTEPTSGGLTQAREYEDKRQLAARLGVSVRTIDNLLVRGLPHLKLTRKLTRFPRAAVDEWLAGRQVRRM